MPSKAKQSTTATKDAPAKTASAKDAPAKKVNPALMKPLQPSKELAAVVGSKPLPRAESLFEWGCVADPYLIPQ